jgi:hypothetical protein
MWDAYAKVSYEKIQAAKAHAETTDELTQGLKDDLKRAADFRSQAADSRAHALDRRAEAACRYKRKFDEQLHVDINLRTLDEIPKFRPLHAT